MNILLLSCNTGAGHNSTGKALMEELSSRGVSCKMEDALRFAPPGWSREICRIHTNAYLHAPDIMGRSYDLAEKQSSTKHKYKSPAYRLNSVYAPKLMRYIIKNNYDAVISVHVFPAEAMTCIRNKYGYMIPSYFVATDYTCSPFVSENRVDAFFIPHKDLIPEFLKKGVEADRIIPTGIPVSRVYQNSERTEPEKKGILIMSGSMGAGPVDKILKLMKTQISPDVRITVICGNNKFMKRKLEIKYRKRITTIGFTDKVCEYMEKSSIVISKAGGLTSTETAAVGIPFIQMDAVPGCEGRNVEFFTSHGMSRRAENASDVVRETLSLLGDREACAQMVSAQRSGINRYAAREICDHVIKDIES